MHDYRSPGESDQRQVKDLRYQLSTQPAKLLAVEEDILLCQKAVAEQTSGVPQHASTLPSTGQFGVTHSRDIVLPVYDLGVAADDEHTPPMRGI